MKKLLILSIVLLLLVSFVSAVPTPKTQTITSTNSFEVSYPAIFFYKDKQNLTFEFHVTNGTGYPLVNGVYCYFHLYNKNGEHIYTARDGSVTEQFDYEFKVNYTNLTSGTGEYYYITNCNNSYQGGMVTSNFYITNSGREIDISQSNIYIIIIIFLIVIMVADLFVAYSMDSTQDYEIIDGVLKFNYKRYLKMLLYFMFYHLLTMLIYMCWQISYEFITAPFITDILRITFIIMEIGLIPVWVITTLVMLVKWLGDVKTKAELIRGSGSR